MENKKCSKCGAMVPADSKFCSECGSQEFEIDSPLFVEKECPHCGNSSQVPSDAQSVFCQHCGKNMTESSTVEKKHAVCPSCGRTILVPAGVQSVVCGGCGSLVDAIGATKSFEGSASGTGETAAQSRVLANWKTSVGASAVGFFASSLLGTVAEQIDVPTPGAAFALLGVVVVWFAACAWYAGAFFPSLFKDDCEKTTSPAMISFLNLFFGGIIFGCMWNSNLTKKQKGISNVVYLVFFGNSNCFSNRIVYSCCGRRV